VRDAAAVQRDQLRRVLFPEPLAELTARTRLAWDGLAACGWSERPALPATAVQPPVARRALGLWATELPVSYYGPRVRLPKGVLSQRVKARGTSVNDRGEGRYAGMHPVNLLVEFSLPAGCPDLRVESARVFLEFRGTGSRAEVRVLPVGATGVNSGVVLTDGIIPRPTEFFDARTRSFTLGINVGPLTATPAGEINLVTALREWQIRELDMEITGVIP
jgi:hypothetical protein